MTIFVPIDIENTNEPAHNLLVATQAQLGRIPNLYRAMANAPTALESYLAFRKILQGGILTPTMKEYIALLTAQENNCEYCVSAHTFRLGKMEVTHDIALQVRKAYSTDSKITAALIFVQNMVLKQGQIDPNEITALIAEGWTEAEIGEIVAHIALNIFSNYFNHISQPVLDFPHTDLALEN